LHRGNGGRSVITDEDATDYEYIRMGLPGREKSGIVKGSDGSGFQGI